MKKKDVDTIAGALLKALTAYGRRGTARAAIAQRLFGVAATPTLLPQLDEIARHVRPGKID